jgi:hypothetical protein
MAAGEPKSGAKAMGEGKIRSRSLRDDSQYSNINSESNNKRESRTLQQG